MMVGIFSACSIAIFCLMWKMYKKCDETKVNRRAANSSEAVAAEENGVQKNSAHF